MSDSINKIILRHLKLSKESLVGVQDIQVWVIEDEGEEESEIQETWQVIYNLVGSDDLEIIQVLDDLGDEIDYIKQGYSENDLKRLVITTRNKELASKSSNSKLKMHEIFLEDLGPIYVCDNCLKGFHQSYSENHLDCGNDCKNTGIIDGKLVQCQCSSEWSELLEKIEHIQKEGLVKRVQDHHRTIVDRGNGSLV